MRARGTFLAIVLAAAPAGAHGVYKIHTGAPTSPLSGDLVYYGGRVLSNVNIVEVAWGSSVDATYLTNLQGFYTFIVTSPFIDWMTEYDTIGKTGFVDFLPGSNQHIGRGTFGGSYAITPMTVDGGTTITDDQIQAELVAQLQAAKLPAPTTDGAGNVNSLYMFDFPQGISISLVGLQSCSSFGAYHGTVSYKGTSVPYGVHPYCGYSFDTSTLIHSHELAEAMTDMEVGLVEYNTTNLSARPLAWVTVAATAWLSDEAGDLCEGTSATVGSYTVQKIWSNYAQGCVAEIPICDGTLVPPACRPCNVYDSGNACPEACALDGPQIGQCVTCSSKYAKACTGATPVCDDATYTCVGCLTNADCAMATPTCDTTSHTCRACASDMDCAGSPGDAGADAGADAGGADAGASLVCDRSSDTEKGQCVVCNTDAQCPTDAMCAAHVCVPRPEPTIEAGPEPPGAAELPTVTTTSSGCGCDVAGGSGATASVIATALGVLALGARRKRHSC